MESLIGGLVVWGYVLAGFVVVPVLAVILTSAFHQTLGKSVATAAAVWYLGAPILLVVLSWLIGLNDMWVAHQYLSLCKKDSIDSISKVSANIHAIKLDSGEPDGRYARSVSAAFGGEHLLFGFKDYPGPYRKADGAHVPGAFVVLKVRATDHIPYMGTFYATGIDLEILDPQTQIPLARRRTFARGIAEQAASGTATDNSFTKRTSLLYDEPSQDRLMRLKLRLLHVAPNSAAHADARMGTVPCKVSGQRALVAANVMCHSQASARLGQN